MPIADPSSRVLLSTPFFSTDANFHLQRRHTPNSVSHIGIGGYWPGFTQFVAYIKDGEGEKDEGVRMGNSSE